MGYKGLRYAIAILSIAAMPVTAKVTVLNTEDKEIGSQNKDNSDRDATSYYTALQDIKLIDKYFEVDAGLVFQSIDGKDVSTVSQRLHIGSGLKVFEWLYLGVGFNGWLDYRMFDIDIDDETEDEDERMDDESDESFSGISVGLDVRLHMYPGFNAPYVRYGQHCYVVFINGLDEPWERDGCSEYWGAGYTLSVESSPEKKRSNLYIEMLLMNFDEADAINLVVGSRF